VKRESDWWQGQIEYRGALDRNALVLDGQMARRNVQKNSYLRELQLLSLQKWLIRVLSKD